LITDEENRPEISSIARHLDLKLRITVLKTKRRLYFTCDASTSSKRMKDYQSLTQRRYLISKAFFFCAEKVKENEGGKD
jgi:hypothetical protein